MWITVPALLLIILFIATPLANAIRISFYKWNGYSQKMKWYDIQNYSKILSDKVFWKSFWNTMIYGFGSTLFQNIFGLLAAIFVNRKFAGRNALRVILYLPIMISAFLMGRILYYFAQLDGGVWNDIITFFGFDSAYWMKTGLSATLVQTAMNVWQYMALCMLIYLSGLQGIPMMYREAARLDGASPWQEFRFVTLPLLMPAITTAVITNLIGGFKMYDVIVAMTDGGPNRGSMSLSLYISKLYYNDEKAGYSAAVGVALFFIIMLITWPINYWLRKREVKY